MHITDNQDELFDMVNNQDHIIGVATRYECHHNKSKIHRAIQVIVYNSQKQIYLQKRSKTKDLYPSLWTLSATGHVMHGDDYLDTAVREVKEELGIDIKKTDLKEIGKLRLDADAETEFEKIYALQNEGPFKLNLIELETGQWANINELSKYHGTPCYRLITNDKKIMQELGNL